MIDTALAQAILAFWFGPAPHAARAEWFRKDPVFVASIRARFGEAIDAAIAGGYRDWIAEPRSALARVLLLDQFPRNVHRDTACAFAGDGEALATAIAAVDAGFDAGLDVFERQFLYLPFEHSEDPAMHERALARFARLADHGGPSGALEWARRHAAVIGRFGRYPHRNAVLGRASTPEEIAFLREPGSRF